LIETTSNVGPFVGDGEGVCEKAMVPAARKNADAVIPRRMVISFGR
jgi:hypothetical protein